MPLHSPESVQESDEAGDSGNYQELAIHANKSGCGSRRLSRFTVSLTFAPFRPTASTIILPATAGIMLDRVVFPVVNKGADDSLTAVFTFTMS